MKWVTCAWIGMMSSAAVAGEIFEEDLGLVEFLPVADVVADGVTPVPVHFLALDGDGKGVEGIEAKLTASSGALQTWTDKGDGVYEILWTPEKSDQMGNATIKLKGKTLEKQTIKRGVTIRTRPWPKTALSLSVNPAMLSAGKVDTATLNVEMADTWTQTRVDDFELSVSVGEIHDMTAMGGNRFTARFEVKEISDPSLAIVTLVDKRKTDRAYGAFAIPVAAMKTETIRAPEGANLIVRIAEREFGPVQATKRGRAEVEILAQPGVHTGSVAVIQGDARSEQPLELVWPEPRRIQWVPLPQGIPGDATAEVPVRIAVFTATGEPDADATLVLSTDSGELGDVSYEGDGIYVAAYRPEHTEVEKEVMLTASLQGQEKVQVHTVGLKLVPPIPHAVTLTSSPQTIGDAKEVTLCAALSGPNEFPLAQTEVIWTIIGGRASGPGGTGPNGCSSLPVTVYGAGLDVVANTGTKPTGNPLDRVVLVDSGGVPADGISSSMLTLMTVDSFGYPVAGVPVRLFLEAGDGALPKEATSDESGMIRVYYTAGRKPGMIRIRANAGQSSAVVGFLQGPPILSERTLPRSGSPVEQRLSDIWSKTVGTISVPR